MAGANAHRVVKLRYQTGSMRDALARLLRLSPSFPPSADGGGVRRDRGDARCGRGDGCVWLRARCLHRERDSRCTNTDDGGRRHEDATIASRVRVKIVS